MRIWNYCLLCVCLLFASELIAQKNYPKNYFRSPVDIPIRLAGNFGEIRSNHFHAGLDIKTNQVEGLNIYAAAEGYVSRIKISLYGYGKVLYITHPNGYTTAYAHLKSFNETIEDYVKNRQYQQQKYEIEIFPLANELKVEKGEVIALSGNTGGSGGPHLHFEIRETATQIPLNPLLFGFAIQDNIKPILKTMSLYPLNDTSIVNGNNEPLHLSLRGSNGNYTIPSPMNLRARGVIGVGLEAIDKLNGASNRCGVYSIKLTVDGKTHYRHEMEKIPFELSRYINTHVDYEQAKKNRRRVQRSFLQANNRLSIYTDMELSGKLFFSTFGHDLNYVVKDAYGNTSTVSASVSLDTISPTPNVMHQGELISCKQPYTFETDSATVHFKANTFYNDVYFTYQKESKKSPYLTDIHHFHNRYTPLHSRANFSISIEDVPTNLHPKLYAVSLTTKGKVLAPEGGTVSNGFIHFKSRSLGPYSVLADTAKPKITLVKTVQGTGSAGSLVIFKIADRESGIKSYKGYLNNQWILMEYDNKTREFWYELDPAHKKGEKQQLRIEIVDAVGNKAEYTTSINW